MSMTRLSILFAAALCLVSSEAMATTYYVRSDGSDSNAGTSNAAGGAWRTISKANSTLRPGDIVNVMSLNPADTSSTTANIIRPSVSGTSATGGTGRITYQGNVSNPQSLPVYQVDLPQKSYITVRGFRLNNGYGISGQTNGAAAVYNVIENCVIVGRVGMRGAQFCRVSNNVMRLQAPRGFGAVYFSGADDLNAQPWCHKDTMSFNVIDLGLTGGDHRTFFVRGFTNNCLFASNRVTTVCDRNGSPDPGLTAYVIALEESFANTYRDNRWEFEIANMLDNQSRWAAIAVRSGTHHNLWERDTMYMGVNSSESMLGDISLGQQSGIDSAQVYANHWKDCVFKTKNSSIRYQLRLADGLIENCVFVNLRRAALEIEDNTGVSISNSVIRHNTFYSRDAAAFRIGARVQVLGTNTIESNIFYTGSTASCSRGAAEWPNNAVSADRNLYFATSGPSSSALKVNQSCYAVGPSSTACSSTGDECNALWSNPLLADINFATFNPSLLSGSPAIGAQFVSGYAGAIPGIDATAPGQVTSLGTLQIADVSAVLRWTAPGDDGQNGTISGYDLRWSTSPINDANFASATPLTPPPVMPAGTQQNYVMLSLIPGGSYYVALKARDEANNVSALSNVLNFSTTITDQTSPARIGDLGAP